MNLFLFISLFICAPAFPTEKSSLKAVMHIEEEEEEEKPYELPKIIWLYWEGRLKRVERYLLHNMKQKIADFTIIFITDSTINYYLDRKALPTGLKSLPKANKADFYRLQLLYDYGGLWMDTSMYLSNDTFLEDCYRDITKAKADLLAFNSWWPPAYHIEFGFLMAPRRSPLIGKVLEEFKIMLSMGVKPYMKDRIKSGTVMKSPYIYHKRKYFGLEHYGKYFAPYVCMQTVIQRDYKGQPNVILRRSEDYWFKLYESCNNDSKCVARKWVNEPEVHEYPIIKFCSATRRYLKFPKVDVI
ncbi:putative Capsular polysaccharide synthesis protein [Monocercomonoides exilis]|uniref:putative Capsular polysaccharide synthesis protein n=1 Tax=Monocercomonoides exilis TaxID=2049356 RepID=UPI00355AC486|nr:putative Capsular polysaccharide synthesis protein [Monocercomonoides exilis]|eukprot:MONOS_7932.1-p1 / transcript=MONOS_7932.1 / gene=MONOS_7932 / organism=Monocercomonoides_exilis_PA203 / gene_product=unspecified product / transcript_product=unspecified product / location=Mono_scaffold00285:13538-14437(+) / protein_length=299 / sequence_SO=supercontig / SO=protein_coding / is_pseudo=false